MNSIANFTHTKSGIPSHPIEKCRVDHVVENNATYELYQTKATNVRVHFFTFFDKEKIIAILESCGMFTITHQCAGDGHHVRTCHDVMNIRDELIAIGLVDYHWKEPFKWIEESIARKS